MKGQYVVKGKASGSIVFQGNEKELTEWLDAHTPSGIGKIYRIDQVTEVELRTMLVEVGTKVPCPPTYSPPFTSRLLDSYLMEGGKTGRTMKQLKDKFNCEGSAIHNKLAYLRWESIRRSTIHYYPSTGVYIHEGYRF